MGEKNYRNRSKVQENIVERGNIDSSNTHTHELLLFLAWYNTRTSLQNGGGVKLVDGTKN